MDIPCNRFRRGLDSGRTQYGLWLGIPDNSTAELLAVAGFDWLLIDHEHAPFELSAILAQLQAIAPYPVAPVVRPVSHDPALLKKLLDIGVQSFLVPMVDDATQARAIVQALHYPPRGNRGLGTSLSRAARWNQLPGYVERANEEICLIVQAETVTAMDNLEDILAVEGVDGVFIGPSDLAASMGHIGDAGHPEVARAIDRGLAAIASAGKHAGMFCLDPALASHYREAGADFLAVGADTALLVGAARALAARFRSGDGS